MSSRADPVIELVESRVARFRDDGFLVVERLIPPALVAATAATFHPTHASPI